MLSRRALVVAERVSAAEGAADGIAAQGKRQTGLLAPPLAEVEELEQAIAGVGELALVNDESSFKLAGDYGGDDLVERNDGGFDLGSEELESEVGGGEGAGDGDAGLLELGDRELAGRDDHGAVALADAAAAGHQGVLVLEVGIGVEADGGDIVESLVDGAVVEGLDVGKGMRELVARDAHLVGGEAVEHKGVVGVGAVGDADLLNGGAGGSHGASILLGGKDDEMRRAYTTARCPGREDLVQSLFSIFAIAEGC